MGIVLKRFAERVGEQEGMGERWHQAGSTSTREGRQWQDRRMQLGHDYKGKERSEGKIQERWQ